MAINPNIFKAYDIRGIYPQEINEETAYALGHGFACFTKSKAIIVARDMRVSGPALVQNFKQGVINQGADVIDIGEVSTDCSYYASGKLNLPAAMFTASHNPAQYNGVKFSLNGAQPVGQNTGLQQIKELSEKHQWPAANQKGKIISKDILSDYIDHALTFINVDSLKELRIVVDAGNGMAGKILPVLADKLPIKIVPLYFNLDGSFPNHEANPIKLENVQDLMLKVKQEKADIGLAFDGDADRVFFIDENGQRVASSLITALISEQLLKKNQGAKIIFNVPCSRIVSEVIKNNGGIGIRERVGHSFIKATMKKEKAVFGGEHSGHYYFNKNYYADSGLIASLIVLEILAEKKQSFSSLLKNYQKYFATEETNSQVNDKEKILVKLQKKYSEAVIDKLDGITFTMPDFWFNVRPSNTEPLLRLNLEAKTEELRDIKLKEVLDFIKNES